MELLIICGAVWFLLSICGGILLGKVLDACELGERESMKEHVARNYPEPSPDTIESGGCYARANHH